MKRFFLRPGFFLLLFLFFFKVSVQVSAQVIPPPYLLPHTIFVGDPGRFVVPLGPTFAGIDSFVIDTFEMLPESADLVFRRIELERRGDRTRLIIDFIPFVAGTLFFPSLEPLFDVANFPDVEFFRISNLEVQIASVLRPYDMTLSLPAPPLAIPGTSFLIYGSIVLLLIVIALGIAGSMWGRRHFRELWERLRRWYLLRVMARFLRHLRLESEAEKDKNPGFYLTRLSSEFRDFLSHFIRYNCRSLTAEEFLELPLGFTAADDESGVSPWLSPNFLCRLFRTWDTLRFSGKEIEKTDLAKAFEEAETFIFELTKAEKKRPFSKSARKSPHVAGVSAPGLSGAPGTVAAAGEVSV